MKFENILVDKKAPLVQITVNRPSKLNALNKATIQELHEAFSEVERDDRLQVVILTG